MNIDRVRSRSLAQAIDAQPKRCWRNCALGLGHLLGAGLYVEGVAVTHFGFATPHAWIETDRTILDPTWDRPGTQYYPVRRYTLTEVLHLLDDSPGLPLYTRSDYDRRDMALAAERARHSCALNSSKRSK